MAKKSSSSGSGETRSKEQLHRYLGWTVLLGAWLLMAAALVSYDMADWPGHAVAPYNDPPHNWVGRFGAWASHKTYLMIGPGVWIIMAGILAFLIATARSKPITQPILRLCGLLVMAFATSALVGLSVPNNLPDVFPSPIRAITHRPEGVGGLLAIFVNRELAARFGGLGTFIIVTVGFWVGAILAMDQIVLALPRLMGRLVMTAGKFQLPRPRVALAGGSSAGKPASLAGGRFSFLGIRSGKQETGTSPSGLLPRKGGTDATDPDAVIEGELDSDETPSGAAEAKPQAGSDTDAEPEKKPLDREALRAKIKQLPINFASRPAPRPTGASEPLSEVDLSGYQFPSLDLLEEPESSFTEEMERLVRDQAVRLEAALQQYSIQGEVVGIDSGPVITLYEVRLAPGTKVSQVFRVSSDLARALRAPNIRVVPNMAGKDTVGVEVPNLKKERVRLKELMTAHAQVTRGMVLPMFLGKDASGNPQIADLAAMPHMLIAGTTGSGKSVCLNSIIMSFLMTKRPDELKLVLVDPKMVEMSMFKDIPHLMCPVVTEMSKATAILEWATVKMDERYELLAEAGVRDIAGYNALGWEQLRERFAPASEAEEARIPKKLPYMVFVIDELADLMMTNREVEGFIVRIAQKARAVGIHLILATQRPQANVVTGLIKSNMPCRVSFKVASVMDSRIVLDHKGAELLLGQGDMLFLSPRTSKLMRAQGTLVDDSEVRKVVGFLKTVAQQNFEPQLVQIKSADAVEEEFLKDPLFDQAVEIVLQTKRGSVSLLQRRLTIGYGRASRLIEQMAEAGIIGQYKGSQAREVMISLEDWEAMKAELAAEEQNAGNKATEATVSAPPLTVQKSLDEDE